VSPVPVGGVESERLTVDPDETLAEEVTVLPGVGVPEQATEAVTVKV
jgi:hypothetical protein